MKPNTMISKITVRNTFVYKSIVAAVISLILNVFLADNSIAQIAIRGGTSNVTTAISGNSNLVINRPAGIVAGDVMFVNIDKYSFNTAPASSGWTVVAGPANIGGTNYGFILYKVADGSEGTSFTFTLGTSTYCSGSMIAFSGVDYNGGFLVGGGAGGPFDVAPGSISTTGGSASSVTVTPISTNTANAAVIMFGMSGGTDNTPPTFNVWSTSSPGTLSEIYDINGDTYIQTGAAWGTKSTTGPTGASSVTLAGGSNNVGAILIALKKFVCPTITTTAGYNSPVCIGATINLTATNASGGTSPYTYGWSGPLSYTSSLQNPAISNSITSMNGTYAVTVTDSKGCTGSSSVAVTVNPLPVSSVEDQTNITCNAAQDGTITVTATGTGPFFFSDDNGASFFPLSPNPGTASWIFENLMPNTPYRIKVKDANTCISK